MVDGQIFADFTMCAHCRLVLDAYAVPGEPLAAADSMGAPCDTCSSRQMNPGATAAASMGKALSSMLHDEAWRSPSSSQWDSARCCLNVTKAWTCMDFGDKLKALNNRIVL